MHASFHIVSDLTGDDTTAMCNCQVHCYHAGLANTVRFSKMDSVKNWGEGFPWYLKHDNQQKEMNKEIDQQIF